MLQRPIFTEPENCQDCYKCIRECPVKAIRIESNKAYIMAERCIYCGHCTQICPTGAKKIRDGVPRVKKLMEQCKTVLLSLAPSYISEFQGVPDATLIRALKKLGFAGVSETALGAEQISAATNDFLLNAPPGVYISSACPVVVEYIRKYTPEYTSSVTPLLSPLLTHGRMLKKRYGTDTGVVFAGPCIGKKVEADNHRDLIDVAITFKDIRKWMEEEGIRLESGGGDPENFIPEAAGRGSLYPVEGGMLKGLPNNGKVIKMAFSGLENIRNVLNGLTGGDRQDTIFLELLSCTGGCINGPGKLSDCSLALKRYDVIHRTEQKEAAVGPPAAPLHTTEMTASYRPDPQGGANEYSEEEIIQALAVVGKTSVADELNCSGCGYDSCRDFARALLAGQAEENMCVSYMRKIAHDKANALLQKIPLGVILADNGLKIVDMNRAAADLLGEEIALIYEASPGLQGIALKEVCSFSNLFAASLSTGQEIRERLIREGDKVWSLSIYTIQPHHLVFGLLQDMREPQGKTEWMTAKTQEVIGKHLQTVQQIACLLGENAAYTDSTLRSIQEALQGKKSNI